MIDPRDIPVADEYSRDDFGTPEEVYGWNLCRDYAISMINSTPPASESFVVVPPPDLKARIAADGSLTSAVVEVAPIGIKLATVIKAALREQRGYLEATQRNGPSSGKTAQTAYALHEAKLQVLVALLEAVAE